RRDRGAAWRHVPAPDAPARGRRIGRPDSAARPETHGPRARGVLSHGPAADKTLRRDGVADSGRRRRPDRRAAAGRADLGAGHAAGRRAVRARAPRRDPDTAREWDSGDSPSVRRTGLPPGARAPARRARRAVDARADRAREPAVRAPAVDLVS